ncbi:MAG TPA: ABC-F family ATP-binding cassette domain-containing protein [Bacteroidia bacterium]|nr:ABC-F family ATP-binding cassette domain-containing protein [Bacteroidia bacterium]
MLVLNNITFEFGARALFSETSWHIKPNEKIGLIGANGTGKSTLLRIIAGEYKLTKGEITGRKNLSIGFLNQDLLSYQSDNSILHVAMEAFEKENKIHDDIEEVLKKLEHDHSEETLHRLHDLQTEYEALDGYNIQYKGEAILEGLGFSTADLKRPLKEFSGGWRMRVMLAKILLTKPDLLLLDEPTNHLDLPSIQWIEEYLAEYEGTIIIVSHDRYFLDGVVTKIVEVDNEKLISYSGNYTFFLQEKAMREEMQRSQFKNQEKYIKEQEKLIDRFRYKASKAKLAQSRIKMLAKLERIDDVENNNAEIRINFNFSQQPGRSIVDLNIKSKKYAEQVIFENTEAKVERGDKIALIGANGKGKSTLLRMIDGGEKFEGTLTPGYNVIQSFYAQHQLESLHLENDLMRELQVHAPEQTDATLRALLGAFLFSGDDVFKKIKVLSGGEKSRVALAKTILTKANFLLLDEPTNHLDIQSVNILIQVLRKYEGSYVIVSHDRFFLAEVANKIWYIENNKLKEYPGTYDEYEMWVEKNKKAPVESKPVEPVNKKEDIKVDARQNDKEKKKEKQKLNHAVNILEEKIEQLKMKKENLLVQLSDESILKEHDKMKLFNHELKTVEEEIEKMQSEWEQFYLQLMEMN